MRTTKQIREQLNAVERDIRRIVICIDQLRYGYRNAPTKNPLSQEELAYYAALQERIKVERDTLIWVLGGPNQIRKKHNLGSKSNDSDTLVS